MRSFPHFFQIEYSDCGPTCLRIILKYYGKSCSLQYVRSLCEVTRAGVSLLDMVKAAERLCLQPTVIRASLQGLQREVQLPCVLHWNQEHFVVLYKITAKYFYISDPTYGRVRLKADEFIRCWMQENEKGIVMMLRPAEDFAGQIFPATNFLTTARRTISYYRSVLKDQRKFVWSLFGCLLLGTVISYIIPQTLKRMVDGGVLKNNLSIAFSMLWFQLALIIGGSLLNWVKDWVRVELSMEVSLRMVKALLFKMVRLPISFYDNGVPSHLYQRIEDQRKIEKFLSEEWVQAFFSLALIVTLNVQLFIFNTLVGLLFTFFTILSLCWFLIFYRRRSQLDYSSFQTSAENHLLVNEMIAGMMEMKINAAQHQKVKQWEGLQARIYDIRKRGLYLHAYEYTGVQLLTQLKNLGINFLCVYLVIGHQLTFGTMMSIGYITGLIAGSMDRLITFLQSLQQSQLTFQRLDEVWQREDEVTPVKTGLSPGVAAGFCFDNVSFKYGGSHQPYIFNDLSLGIPQGKVTAIVGLSGSGKTTLLKLLLAFYNPQQGSIRLNEQDLSLVNNDEWRGQCGVVMQDGFIFSGTIAQNIALGEETPNEKMLEKAITIACLTSLVNNLPMGYNTKIGKTGMELSGGEKQRILIARAVYKNPNYLFFDEATSNLDASNEKLIMQQLIDFFKGKTVVVIAHRLSTVKNADQIVVLEKGKITGLGDHNQLIQKGGTYLELIKNQLELGR